MKLKQEHINYWKEQAKDDWSAVDVLFKGSKYLQSLFFAHLVIEKLCKSIWIKYNQDNIPPRTHNLIYLLSSTPIALTVEQSELLLSLNRFQLEGRYPDYQKKMYSICNEQFTISMLNDVNQFRLWLLQKLH